MLGTYENYLVTILKKKEEKKEIQSRYVNVTIFGLITLNSGHRGLSNCCIYDVHSFSCFDFDSTF